MRRHPKKSSRLRIYTDRTNLLHSPNHAGTELRFKQAIQRTLVLNQTFSSQSFENQARQPNILQNGWNAVEGFYSLNKNDGVARLHIKLARHFGRCAHALDFDNAIFGALRLIDVRS